MEDTYSFKISHVGKEGTGYFGKRYGRIDEPKFGSINIKANSLEEAKKILKNSPEVARNKQLAEKRQVLDDTPRPRLVIRSIIKNPGQSNQKILKETAFQKELREREIKEFKSSSIQKTEQLYKDGLITNKEKLRTQREIQNTPIKGILLKAPSPTEIQGSPGLEGQNIKNQPGGARFTTPLGRFTGKKIPPKTSMNEGGIVKGEKGGFIRQKTKTVRIF
jgi:hypothetical protein